MLIYLLDPSTPSSDAELARYFGQNIQHVTIVDLAYLDRQHLVIADVEEFLAHTWQQPTIVLAQASQGAQLAQAWQKGALAGWVRGQLPIDALQHAQTLLYQFLRHQDFQDLPAAALLQQRLLPVPLTMPGYKVEHFLQPSAYLSGDWVDYWAIDTKHILFYLADVAGHGVESSLLSAWLAGFHGSETCPERLLNRMNRLLLLQNSGKHITILCGLLSLEDHRVMLYSLGHYPPPILLPRNQPPRTLPVNSLPLGLSETLNLQPLECPLMPGAQLIFASDGALEAFGGGTSQQLEQLIAQLASHSFRPATSLPDDLAMLRLTRLD